ncbi:MAG: hypothetical protein ACREJT_03245, partial [Myxococcota bacterium]
VKTAWLGDQKERAWTDAYQTIRAKYTVLVPGLSAEPSANAAPGAPAKPLPDAASQVPPL